MKNLKITAPEGMEIEFDKENGVILFNKIDKKERKWTIVCGEKIYLDEITEIFDIERDKKMFLNRDAGFVVKLSNGSRKVFGERIPYETTIGGIHSIKSKWGRIENELTKEWEQFKDLIETAKELL